MASRGSWYSIINFIAFIAVIFIGIVLCLSLIGFQNTSITGALRTIANVLAYIVVAFCSFFYAIRKRNIWFIICWTVAVVLIVVFYIVAGYNNNLF